MQSGKFRPSFRLSFRWAARRRDDQSARSAPRQSSPITRAAVTIARSVTARRPEHSSPGEKPKCCRFPIITLMFTLPAAVADIAYHQKATVYDVLFKASAETLIAIAADPRQLSARIGVMSVLHTWGSALTHHPPSSSISKFESDHAAWSSL